MLAPTTSKSSNLPSNRRSKFASSVCENLIGDLLSTDEENDKLRRCIAKVLVSRYFDLGVGFIIVINAACIGLEQSFRLQGKPTTVFQIIEHIFIIVYGLELGCRFFVLRWTALSDNWIKLDVLLVCISIITEWIVAPLSGLAVIKAARLARLARTLRLLNKFRQLWLLVRGFLASLHMIVYTMIVLAITLYIFAVIGVEVITDQQNNLSAPGEYKDVTNKYFRNLPLAMLTLVQFLCVDDTSQIYRPLVEYRPFLATYFMSLILVVSIVLTNVVTAVLVNGALEKATADKALSKQEKKLQKIAFKTSLQEMFTRLDSDGAGKVTREELIRVSCRGKTVLDEFMESSSPVEVFDQLDVDSDGTLDIKDFVEGLCEGAMSKSPFLMTRIDKRLHTLKRENDAMKAVMHEILDKVQTLAKYAPHTMQQEAANQQIECSHFAGCANLDDDLLDAEHAAAQPFALRSPSCKQDITVDVQITTPVIPVWAKDIVFELRQLRVLVHRLGVNCQKQQNQQATSSSVLPPSLQKEATIECKSTGQDRHTLEIQEVLAYNKAATEKLQNLVETLSETRQSASFCPDEQFSPSVENQTESL